jgi:hypothetical protein
MRSDQLRTAACTLALLLLNLYICRELFVTEYTRHLGSIEAAYISISRYLMDNWRDLTWFPLWYTGVPFQNTYPPLLHVVVAAAAQLLRISPALAHHAVAGALYCLGPVTLFWMAYRVSGARAASWAAGLLFSILSPAGFLIYGVRKDMDGLFHARRFQTLVQYGEGPHIASLTLLPLAILALHWALRRRRVLPAYLAAAALAAVVLANLIGGAALLLAALAYLLSGLAEKGWRAWRDGALIAVLAYLLAGPWIPPTTLLAIRTNAQKIGGEFPMGPRQLFYGLLLLAAAFVLARLPLSSFLRFCVLFSFLTGGVALSAEWYGFFLLPQPHRYHLEMEMGLCLTLAFGARPLFHRLGRHAAMVLLGVALIAAAWQTRTYRRYARGLIQPLDITTTIEYRTARWLGQAFSGRRVMAPGTISFWLNTFTDLPQLGGGFEQGIINSMNRHVIYGLYANQRAERGGEYGVLWLKAYGVHAVVMGGRRSREYYKPIRDPDKFRGLLPELWREGDDAIFGVPHRTSSLARVVPRAALVSRKLAHALDAEPLRPYVAALEDPTLPEASFQWLNRHRAAIRADLPPGHVVSIQISYHPGWRARVNGRETPLQRDNLDLMVLDPGWDGPMTIDLEYDGGREMRLLRWLRWCALLYLVVHTAGRPAISTLLPGCGRAAIRR